MNMFINKTTIKSQNGFSLIELMIGVVVGLIAVAATISAFTSIVGYNADYLKMVRLNQELNAVMTLITRDLKRAGYSGTATGVTNVNSFMVAEPIAFTNAVSGTTTRFQGITFGYDVDNDGAVDSANPNEKFGFRYDSAETAIEARQNTTWANITDEDSITITDLIFVNDSLSLPSSTAQEIRYIEIRLSGRLPDDPSVARTISERVRVRNDRP